MPATGFLTAQLFGTQIKSAREVGTRIHYHDLGFSDQIVCAMCGTEMHLDRFDQRFGVPWYCGPVLESDGGRDVCEPCYERWLAWFRSMCYWGA